MGTLNAREGSIIQAMPLPKRYYTIAEWEKLPDNPRYELIDGELTMMASASTDHQRISAELCRQFANYLLGKRCAVMQDVTVRLREKVYRPTAVRPDLIVVCDPKKIQTHGVVGAPDLVIEILSPSTAGIDKVVKFDLYKQAGVREYWIVDPSNRVVDVFEWEKGPAPQTYVREDKIKVGMLDNCEIDLSFVFPELEEPEIDLEFIEGLDDDATQN